MVQSRVLILLDESSSMIQPWASGKEKYKAARELILRLMDSVYAVNNQVEFSLRVFGHQHTVAENNCYDTKNEVAFRKDNRAQMQARLEDISPLGVTPIAFALTEAADKDIVDEQSNAYSIILITDGGESCGGDICEVMKKLVQNKVYFKPYIVSLENDPSLKVTYACMGDFLQVTREKDIARAVSTIVAAFRPVIRINADDYKKMQDVSASAPSVLKVSIPVKKDTVAPVPEKKKPAKAWQLPPTETIGSTRVLQPLYLPTAIHTDAVNPVTDVPAVPRVSRDTLVRSPAVKMRAMEYARPVSVSVKPPSNVLPAFEQPRLNIPKVIPDTPHFQHTIDHIAKMRPEKLMRFMLTFVIDDKTYPLEQVPPIPPVKPEPATAIEPVTTKAVTVETKPADHTTVSVYFTNGMGKFYTTSPQVVLLDAATKKPVKKFYRFVDPAGNPDPQTDIPPGVYDLTLAARPDYLQPGIEIKANQDNKIVITVKNTKLSFAYDRAPKRPVKEFYAVVTERTKALGRVQEQKCIEAMQYEPGNYHIEINTFPKDIRNVDLDFDGETVITVAQPGFVKFNSDGKIRSVTLYQRLGEKFLSFYTLDLSDPRSQHLQIQPGEYQAHYQSGPKLGFASEQVQLFRIKSTETTEVTLK